MKAIRTLCSAAMMLMLAGISMSFTTEEKSRIVEDGGTGPYKAVMKEEASLEAHTVFEVWQGP